MQEFLVTKMELSDREAIRKICCDTGYVGNNIGPYIDDKDLFADLWTLYYTDFEPHSAFVARVDGRTVGYLTGCLDTSYFNRIFVQKIVPRILFKTACLQYRIGKKTGKYVIDLLSQLRKGNIYPPLNIYPAHLHINIDDGYRRGGIGEALMDRYLHYLKENNITGVHLGTTSLNTTAVPFYEKLGFELYNKVKNSSFKDREAYSLTYVKTLYNNTDTGNSKQSGR